MESLYQAEGLGNLLRKLEKKLSSFRVSVHLQLVGLLFSQVYVIESFCSL